MPGCDDRLPRVPQQLASYTAFHIIFSTLGLLYVCTCPINISNYLLIQILYFMSQIYRRKNG
jgi:hypothetical protein